MKTFVDAPPNVLEIEVDFTHFDYYEAVLECNYYVVGIDIVLRSDKQHARKNLSRAVLKTDTCTIKLPEIETELSSGKGKFCTVDDLIREMRDNLSSALGMVDISQQETTAKVMSKLDDILACDCDFEIVIEDPLGNSLIQCLPVGDYGSATGLQLYEYDPFVTCSTYHRNKRECEEYDIPFEGLRYAPHHIDAISNFPIFSQINVDMPNTCAATSVAMVMQYHFDNMGNVSGAILDEVITRTLEAGLFKRGDNGGMDRKGMAQLANLYGFHDVEHGSAGDDAKESASLIRSLIKQGLPVVVGARVFLSDNLAHVAHAMVIIGMDDHDNVLLVDPFNSMARRKSLKESPRWVKRSELYTATWQEFDKSWVTRGDDDEECPERRPYLCIKPF
jgi:uncharacterized protein YvpB